MNGKTIGPSSGRYLPSSKVAACRSMSRWRDGLFARLSTSDPQIADFGSATMGSATIARLRR